MVHSHEPGSKLFTTGYRVRIQELLRRLYAGSLDHGSPEAQPKGKERLGPTLLLPFHRREGVGWQSPNPKS